MTDTRVVGASVQGESDTYPVWTLRFTWRVTDAKDNPQQTYVFTTSETDAVDRAVFEYDHRDPPPGAPSGVGRGLLLPSMAARGCSEARGAVASAA